MSRCCLILLLLLSLSPASPVSAATVPITPAQIPSGATLITFETAPGGSPVALGTLAGSICASQGVTFDSNDLVGDPPAGNFTITSPPNVLSGDNTSALQPIHAAFSPSVTMVGAWGFDFTLEVFDQQGNSLGAVTHTNGSPGYTGVGEVGFLGFSSSVPIATAQFRVAFPDSGFGYHIDDLVYLRLPEPSSVVLLGLGALGIGLARLRRRRATGSREKTRWSAGPLNSGH